MDFDIAIVGAGPAGLSLARALEGLPLRIGLLEQQAVDTLAAPPFDGREIALTHHSVRLLKDLGIWDHLDAADIAPLQRARVRDGRALFALNFSREGGADAALGYLVSNHRIRAAAFEAVREQSNLALMAGVSVTAVQADPGGARLGLADGRTLNAGLLVAADSRFSQTRRALGVPVNMHDFGKTMLVARLAHEAPHHGVAQEWFAYGATVATLPLNESASSVVITEPAQRIEALMAMSDGQFAREIEDRLGGGLGAMQVVSTRHTYPLVATWAQRFVGENFALVGDAAVGMHPVTAHGFNIGLRSVESLARGIRVSQQRRGRVATAASLADYQLRHRQAALPLFHATNAVVKLYTDDRLPARVLRQGLLRAGEHAPGFRALVARMLSAP